MKPGTQTFIISKEDLVKIYKQGFIHGLDAYAWWKDGKSYVGNGCYTLKEAIEQIEDHPGYQPGCIFQTK